MKRRGIGRVAMSVIFLVASLVWSEEVKPLTVEERLQQLEGEVKALRKANQELRQQFGLDGKPGLAVVKPAGREPVLALGGLLQAQADFLDKGDSRFKSANDRFYLRRARVNATGKFLDEFDFRIELELAGTLSESANLRAQMTDGFINWNHFEFANIKVGQFKTPFGFEQLYSDPKLFTIERSLVNDVLTLGRAVGAQLGGTLLDKRITYAAGIFNGTLVNFNYNDNDQFTIVDRVSVTPWRGKLFGQEGQWTLGANYFYSDDVAATNMSAELSFTKKQFAGIRHGCGADLQFHLGPFDLWAEYLGAEFRPDDRKPDDRFHTDGWYVLGGYFVVPKKLQAIVKYETFDPRRYEDGNSTDTWTFGLNYYIKGDDLKLQLNYLLVDANGEPDNRSKLLLRLQAIF